MAEQQKTPKLPKPKLTFRESLQEIWVPYSQLLPFLLPYRWRFIFGLVCGSLAGVMSGGLGWVIKHVSDTVFKGTGISKTAMMHGAQVAGPGVEAVVGHCLLIPAFMIARGVFTYLAAYCMAWVGLKLVVDLRNALFKHVLGQSLDFFNKMKAGNLISHVANDTRMAQQALTQVGADLVVQPITIITAICVLVRMDWKFTIISLVLFPICLVPIIVYGKKRAAPAAPRRRRPARFSSSSRKLSPALNSSRLSLARTSRRKSFRSRAASSFATASACARRWKS